MAPNVLKRLNYLLFTEDLQTKFSSDNLVLSDEMSKVVKKQCPRHNY